MSLSKLGIFIGLAGILTQAFWMPAIQAQSTDEQKLCKHNGKYVVFAQRPLKVLPIIVPVPRGDRNNIELAHEHIFFCNNGRIERNIGFGPDGMFSERAFGDYTLIDDKRYDSDVINSIIPQPNNQCYIGVEGIYGLRSNNCQDFADRVRQEYWRQIGIGGNWQSRWTSPEGYFFEFKMQLVISSGNNVNGLIVWKLVKSPRIQEQSRIGLAATEYVSGTWNPNQRLVNIAGRSKDDPQNVIALDQYRISMSEDGQLITGESANHGNWQGRISGNRVISFE